MAVHIALFAVYAGFPAAAAAATGALVSGWRGAAGVAAVSIAYLVLVQRVIPPSGFLIPIFAGAGIAALLLLPVLALRPATPRWVRALIGAVVVAGAGTYIVISNPGIA
jgi:hypothetical protein